MCCCRAVYLQQAPALAVFLLLTCFPHTPSILYEGVQDTWGINKRSNATLSHWGLREPGFHRHFTFLVRAWPPTPTFHHTDKSFGRSATSLSSLTTVAIKSAYVRSGSFETVEYVVTFSFRALLKFKCPVSIHAVHGMFLLPWPLHISACEMKRMHGWTWIIADQVLPVAHEAC